MTVTDETRCALRCPIDGTTLVEVSPGSSGSCWRRCQHCRALIRFDLPAGRWTIEEPPRRR